MDSSLLYKRACACTLGRAFGYKPKIAHRIVEALGGVEGVFSLSEKEKDELLGPFSRYRGAVGGRALEESLRELEQLAGLGVGFIAFGEEDYPQALALCPDAPLGLYYRSSSRPSEIFSARPLITIVGTRDITPYGREWCRRIVFALAEAPVKPCIVSGLAYGVDATAHTAALEAGLPTVAVIPTGPDSIYPKGNIPIANQIASSEGSALVTDFPPGTGPERATFLRRNRIIAGLSSHSIVVESKIKGGSLITARYAFSYGREVFALPGRADDLRSHGCNALIAEKIAEPITDLSLLIRELGLGTPDFRAQPKLEDLLRSEYASRLAPEKMDSLIAVASCVRAHRGISIEDLAGRLALPFLEVSALVSMLESDGYICTDLLRQCTLAVRPPARNKKA